MYFGSNKELSAPKGIELAAMLVPKTSIAQNKALGSFIRRQVVAWKLRNDIPKKDSKLDIRSIVTMNYFQEKIPRIPAVGIGLGTVQRKKDHVRVEAPLKRKKPCRAEVNIQSKSPSIVDGAGR